MKLLLGVTGGIAAYKACELTSLALKRGHAVRVVMTRSATEFVGPTTFAGLTGQPVMLDTFSDAMAHIEWAKWADVACVAPLTANTLSKIALGMADSALTTVLLALPRGRPVILGPAMNTEMWENPATQRNLSGRAAGGEAAGVRGHRGGGAGRAGGPPLGLRGGTRAGARYRVVTRPRAGLVISPTDSIGVRKVDA